MNARAHVIRWMRRPRVPALLLVPMLLLGAPPGVAHAAGGRISGQVLDEHGVPVASARVSIQGADEAKIVKAKCDAFGFYRTKQFPAGKYLVLAASSGSVEVPGRGLLPRWHGDAATSRLATPVAVAAEGETKGIDVHLPRGGTISGRVTGAGGAPVTAASVEVIPWEGGNGGSGLTGEDGTYLVDALAPGAYKIRFDPPGDGGFLPSWHPGAAHAEGATLVTIGLGEDVAGIDGALSLGGSISGRVTGVGGVPRAGCAVQAVPAPVNFSEKVRYTYTDANGEYRIPGLATASYHVVFSNYLWYPAQPSPEGAVAVAVVAGVDTPGIHGSLGEGTSIAGRVTTTDGAPVARVRVKVKKPSATWWQYETSTNSAGAYLIGLTPGTFQVCFWPPSDLVGYFPWCYDGPAAWAGFDPVTVLFDQTTAGIDAVMEQGGSIGGRITRPGGSLFSRNWAEVYVYDSTGTWVARSEVDDEGRYQVTGLPAGRYRLYDTAYGQYAANWYPGTSDPAAATEVESGPGLAVSGIDWERPIGGVIKGRVTRTDGSGVPHIRVEARSIAWQEDGYTDSEGKYRVDGLPAGEYTLYFRPFEGDPWSAASPLLGRWYDGKRTEAQADHLTVQLGQTLSGVNARLPRGGSVTGLVTGEGGAPLASVHVVVEPADGTGSSFASGTNSRGRYVIGWLPRGEYRVRFYPPWDSGYLGQWYQKRARAKDADTIVVVEEETVRGIDARLTLGVSVVGRVTDARGVALGYGSVEWYKGRDQLIGKSWVDQHGFYTSCPIESGQGTRCFLEPGVNYRIRFVPPHEGYPIDGPPGGFLPQWYRRRDAAADADPIVVPEPGGEKTVNVRLDRGGAITGRVTADGDPFRRVSVAVYSAEGGERVSEWSWGLSLDGRYRLDGLPSGSYRVEFQPGGGEPFLPQWYDGRPTPEDADPVPVTAGATTPGIDAVLAPAP